jgi:hyperosmotically inducible periplasmic protein
MTIRKLLLAAVCAAPLVVCAADPAADNTEKNERDSSGETLTPIDQSNDPADIKITAETRKMLIADEKLSTNAKNCKVITTAGGVVTLRGPVDSVREKATVAKYAKKAGASSVTNELEIKTTN